MTCKKCGRTFEGNFCPDCGTKAEPVKVKKKKKHRFLKFLLILVMLVVVLLAATEIFDKIEKDKQAKEYAAQIAQEEAAENEALHESFDWNRIVLKDLLPDPQRTQGKITANSDGYLSLSFPEVEKIEYDNYQNACIGKGFTEESESTSKTYNAYNNDDYKLSLSYDVDEQRMNISLIAPMQWDNVVLLDYLPIIEKSHGTISKNTNEEFAIVFNDVSSEKYSSYLNACIEKGYTVDSQSSSDEYEAYNAEGYKLSLDYSDYSKQLKLKIIAPMQLENITWPSNNAAKLIPKTKSLWGKLDYENEDAFAIYIGKTSKSDFNNYIDSCSKKGFKVNYERDDTSYYAEDKNGNTLRIQYEGCNVIWIEVELAAEEPKETNTPKPTATPKTKTSSSGLSTDFKKAMDSYEEFFDEYIEFMKKYSSSSSNVASMTADYLKMLQKYEKTMAEMTAWESKDLNEEELKYYNTVTQRISKKLLEVAY